MPNVTVVSETIDETPLPVRLSVVLGKPGSLAQPRAKHKMWGDWSAERATWRESTREVSVVRHHTSHTVSWSPQAAPGHRRARQAAAWLLRSGNSADRPTSNRRSGETRSAPYASFATRAALGSMFPSKMSFARLMREISDLDNTTRTTAQLDAAIGQARRYRNAVTFGIEELSQFNAPMRARWFQSPGPCRSLTGLRIVLPLRRRARLTRFEPPRRNPHLVDHDTNTKRDRNRRSIRDRGLCGLGGVPELLGG